MKKFALLILVSAALGFLNFLINPARPVLEIAADELTIEMVLTLPKDILIVDARSVNDFERSHVQDAINLSEESFDEQISAFLDVWEPDSKIIVYCSSGACNSSRNIANRLRDEFEIKNVFILRGDWQKWKR